MNEQHRKHDHEILSTDHIKNVQYLDTHDLVRCTGSCNFYGWVSR